MTLNQALETLRDNLRPSEFKKVRLSILDELRLGNITVDDLENVLEHLVKEIIEVYSE